MSAKCEHTGKIGYPSKSHALTVLGRILRRPHPGGRTLERRAYRCPDCGHWHLTRRPTWTEQADSPAAVGARITQARRDAGLTQRAVGEQVGCGQKGVDGWESGQAIPTPARLARLAEVLGVTTRWLLTGRETR